MPFLALMTTPSIGQSLTDTLSQTVHYLQTHLRPILLGAIIFGSITWAPFGFITVLQIGLDTTVPKWLISTSDMQKKGMDTQVNQQVQQVQQDAIDISKPRDPIAEGMAIFTLILIGAIAFAAFALVSTAYYVLIAVKEPKGVLETLKLSLRWAVPVFFLNLWIALRSFIWIPSIGPLIAFFLAPRFVLAPLYLIEQGKGIMQSASLSYAKTKNNVLRILVVGLTIGITTMTLGAIMNTAIFLLSSSIGTFLITKLKQGIYLFVGTSIGFLLDAIIIQLIVATLIVAMITLGRSIINQPVVAPTPTPKPAA